MFLGFVTGDDFIGKMFGLGLGLAILIDVLIVRMVIAPAVVTLLGDRAWWLPAWLDRVLPNVSLEGRRRTGDLEERDEEPSPRRSPSERPAAVPATSCGYAGATSAHHRASGACYPAPSHAGLGRATSFAAWPALQQRLELAQRDPARDVTAAVAVRARDRLGPAHVSGAALDLALGGAVAAAARLADLDAGLALHRPTLVPRRG